MPKVLIVAYYFPPLGGGGTQRTLKFMRYLPDFRWEPHVLTVQNSRYLVYDESLAGQLNPAARVLRTRAMLPARFARRFAGHDPAAARNDRLPGRGLLSRLKKYFYTLVFMPDEYIGWYPFALREGLACIEDNQIDIVLSTGPPNTCHLIGRALAKKAGLPWVADLRDLWDMYPDNCNPFRWRWRQQLDDRMERAVLQDAARIIVVSRGMRLHLLHKIPALKPKRLHVITNGFDPDDFGTIRPPAGEKHFKIVHAGTLFPWRPLRPVLLVLQRLFAQHPEFKSWVRLELLGLIPASDRVAIRETRLAENVEILNYQSYHETLRHLAAADLLLLLVGNIPHARVMIPGKLFDYFGAGRPILAIGPEGDATRLLREEKSGVAFRADQTEKMARFLAAWLRRVQDKQVIFPQKVYEKYQRRYLTGKLAEILNAEI